MVYETPGAGESAEKKNLDVTGTYETPEALIENVEKAIKGEPARMYSRYAYPELQEKEKQVKEAIGLEKGEVLLYNSGMAALTEALQASLRPGDTLLYDPHTYVVMPEVMADYEKRRVRTIPVNFGDAEAIRLAIRQYRPTVLIGEVVSNSEKGMSVIDIDALLETVTETNKRYEEEFSFRKVLLKRLQAKSPEFQRTAIHYSPEDLEELANLFEETAQSVETKKSYLPLRSLLKELEEKYDFLPGRDARESLLEIKAILEQAWNQKRHKPLTVILDNTFPTESGNDLVKKVEEADFPLLVAESGTKFFAKDKANLGIIYGSHSETMQTLAFQRMRTGGVLAPAAAAVLPEINKEMLGESAINRKNAKHWAETLDRVRGHYGIEYILHPNLPNHPNYAYASEKYPEGASPLFYVECRNALETAKALHEKVRSVGLGDKIKYSVSFGFDDTRFFVENGETTSLRIAAGKETAEEIMKMMEAILVGTIEADKEE